MKAKIVWTVLLIVFLGALYLIFSQRTTQLHILGEEVSTTRAMKDVSISRDGSSAPKFDLMKYDDMVQKANLDLASGTGVYDVILQYNTALANYIRNKYILSLSDMRRMFPDKLDKGGHFVFEDDLFSSCWKEIGWFKDKNGTGTDVEPYVIPFSANTMLMAYNKELFENADNKRKFKEKFGNELTPPRTWSDFLRIAEFFHRPQMGIFGICMHGNVYFNYYEWANIAYSMNGGLMRKQWGWEGDLTTPVLLTSPETIQATKLYLNLKKFVDASDDFFSIDAVTQVDILKKKKVALSLVWSDVAYQLSYDNQGKQIGIYNFAPIPGNVSMLAGGSFYINNRSKNKKAAAQYVLSQMDKNTQISLMKKGLCSPLKSVYNDPEIQQIPYANALKTSLERGVYMLEAGPDADAVITIISDSLQKLMKDPRGSEKVEEILSQAQNEIEKKRMEIFKYVEKRDDNK